MNPRVSIIIPTYNRAVFLEEAIGSILDQTFRDWELMVIDDGSTDGTEALMKVFTEKDSRIHYLRQNRGGVSRARNLGIEKATGKYLAFLDDDDLFLPQKLEIQVAYLEKHPEISFVYAQAEIIGLDGKRMRIDPEHPVRSFRELFEQSGIRIQTVMCTQEMFQKAGPFDETLAFGEDYDLWLRMARLAPFHYMEQPVVKFRIHGTNACNDHLNLYLQRERILEKVALDARLGLTHEIKDLRLSLNEYRLGKLFYEKQNYREASRYFWRAVTRQPKIGILWAQQDSKARGGLSVMLKPYAAALYCTLKAIFQ